jgi:hypothetical protein
VTDILGLLGAFCSCCFATVVAAYTYSVNRSVMTNCCLVLGCRKFTHLLKNLPLVLFIERKMWFHLFVVLVVETYCRRKLCLVTTMFQKETVVSKHSKLDDFFQNSFAAYDQCRPIITLSGWLSFPVILYWKNYNDLLWTIMYYVGWYIH